MFRIPRFDERAQSTGAYKLRSVGSMRPTNLGPTQPKGCRNKAREQRVKFLGPSRMICLKLRLCFFFFLGGGGGLYVYTVYGTYMYIYLQYTVLFFGLGIDEIQFESMLGILAQVFIRWDGMFLWIAQ